MSEHADFIDEFEKIYGTLTEPIRRKRTLIVKVLVFELDTDEQIREHKINFFDEKQLAWFKNMLFWATFNYKYVKIYNVKDV